ncbi:MAG: prepilin-type N-terminal cleavage/methylation domain-containing protein [Acidobacteriota bacterium]
MFNHLRHRQRGFTLIELLLVVLIIGLIASILIPNLIDAIHKAKQRRTMGELRLIGTAWMNWFTDHNGAAASGAQKTYNVATFSQHTYPQMFGYLHPSDTFFYIQEVPQFDPWGSPLRYFMNDSAQSEAQMLMCALARDGIPDFCDGATNIPIGPFIATDFDSDIIWADGYLLRWPDI